MWIITVAHRPMYCSSDHLWNDCTTEAAMLRHHLEPLFNRYKVDLAIWAHEHTYERSWPVYKSQVINNENHQSPYHNPNSTVHVVSGAGGMYSGLNGFDRTEPWLAFRQSQYGYGLVTVNRTHLKWEYKNTAGDMAGYVVDSFTIEKT